VLIVLPNAIIANLRRAQLVLQPASRAPVRLPRLLLLIFGRIRSAMASHA